MATRKSASGFIWIVVALSLVQTGCGGAAPISQTPAPSPGSSPNGQVRHVFIVVEENHGYSSVLGNPDMTYLNGLATTYAFAKGYYANTHPSIGNYFMLTAGQIITNHSRIFPTCATTALRPRTWSPLASSGRTWPMARCLSTRLSFRTTTTTVTAERWRRQTPGFRRTSIRSSQALISKLRVADS